MSLANIIGDKYKIVIIFKKKKKNEAESIVSNTSNTISQCGELTIPELYYLLKKICLAISLDTGAMQLCDAAKTKLITLFPTRDLSNKWFPNNKNAIVMEKVLPCSFCLKTVCKNNICISSISPEDVFSNIKQIL